MFTLTGVGPEAIFLDTKSVPLGERIQDYIKDSIHECAVILPVIGKNWLKRMADAGLGAGFGDGNWKQRRDWVIFELEEALANPNLHVIPLLIDDTPMPRDFELPDSIKTLSERNGIPLKSQSLHESLPMLVRRRDVLIEGSALELPPTRPSPTDDEPLRQAHYRHEVRYCLESNDGQLDSVSEIYLDALRQHLQLTREVTRRIQITAQQPYQRYTATVEQLIAHQFNRGEEPEPRSLVSLDQRSINHLRRLHHHLALPRWKAKKIETQMLNHWEERRAAAPKP